MKNSFISFLSLLLLSGCVGKLGEFVVPDVVIEKPIANNPWQNPDNPFDVTDNGYNANEDSSGVCKEVIDWYSGSELNFPSLHPEVNAKAHKLDLSAENVTLFVDVNGDGYASMSDCISAFMAAIYLETFFPGQIDPKDLDPRAVFEWSIGTLATFLDNTFGFYQKNGSYQENEFGQNEKSLYDAWGLRWAITPDGTLYFIKNGELVFVDKLMPQFHTDPRLLHQAAVK